MFADPSKVRRIEHAGRFFKSRGPLNVVRSPQNGPAILQAGTSGKGRDFAASYADAIFAIQPHRRRQGATTPTSRAAWSSSAARRRLQDPVRPAADRRRHARPRREDKQEEHNGLVPLEGGLAILSAHLDFDLSTLAARRPDGGSHRARAAAHEDALPHADRRADDRARGRAAPRPERRPAAVRRHARRRRRPDGGLLRRGRRRRLHAVADLLPRRDRGVRRPGRARAAAPRPLPARNTPAPRSATI